jgi:hypothetical protein
MSRTFPLGFLVSLMVVVAGCTKSPSAPTSSASSTGSVAAPRPTTPTNLAQIAYAAQPVTLVVQNAIVTQPGGTTYAFEVATDAGFTNKVQTKSGVAEGGGQTSLTLGALAAATTYYWHAQATGGGTTGVFGSAFQFTIGPLISISAPTPVSPANGANTTTQPTLIVNNATTTGPVGPITYRFDISTSATFATVQVTGPGVVGTTQSSFTPPSPLTLNTTYYWRATAVDVANVIAGPASAVQSFIASMPLLTVAETIAAQEGIVLWSGVRPPGVPGHAQLGPGWGVGYITDVHGITFLNPLPEALRVFDLLDRGMAPQGAIDWMNGNGYPSNAFWYPGPQVVGFTHCYMAFVNGKWEIVQRLE